MLIYIPLTEDPPTVTSQEKGETIKYKWIMRNGRRVSVPYIHHYEKPEVARARGLYVREILKYMKAHGLEKPHFEGPCRAFVAIGFKARRKKDIGKLKDVLGDLGFFKVGDQQIGDLRVVKVWEEIPFILINIEPYSEALDDIFTVQSGT